jgi:hypothetical protein
MLMMLIGMIGAGRIYMDMRQQRHLHDRLAGMKFKLAEQTDWRTETFSPHDTGYHTLHLSTINTSSKSLRAKAQDDKSSTSDTSGEFRTFYHGTFEARIADPSNNIIWTKHIEGSTFFLALPSNTVWIFVDSVHIQNMHEGLWKFQTRVTHADENFAPTYSELILMPPQAMDIGFYIYGQSLKLIGMGLLIPIGFCTVLLGGYFQKRVTRSGTKGQSIVR